MSKYASLHAGLLARKGEASPAIPSGFANASYVDAPPPEAGSQRRDVEARSSRSVSPSKPVVECDRPRAACEDSAQAPSCCAGAGRMLPQDPHAGIERTGRAEVRLTAEQRRRLRTVAVQTSRSQQRILSDALDAWLDRLCETEMQDCTCLRPRPE
jgi:hypothetical protein